MSVESPTPGELLIGELSRPNVAIVAHLAKSVNVDGDDVIALTDLVECDFPGYSSVRLTDFEDVDPENPDMADVLSAIIQFWADGISQPEEAVAFYTTISIDGDAAGLDRLELFQGPFVFWQDGDIFERQIRYNQSLES